MGEEIFIPKPLAGLDPVSQSLNEFYLELAPANTAPFVALKLHLIRPDAVPDVSFYVKRGTSYRVFRRAQDKFTSFELKSLVESGIEKLYMERQDAPSVRQYLETFLTNAPSNENVPMEAQVGLLRSHAVRLTEEIFADPSPQNIRKGMKMVSNFVNVLLRDPKAFYYLINLSSHDAYTYQHSVGVGLNAIALAKKLNLTTEQELMELGTAGLLHDIGKTRVNPAIINKPGPLDAEEWKEMIQHPEWGHELVKDNADLTDRIKLAVRHHHEEMSGNGYPDKLPAGEISLFAKIVAIADIFNALTTDRTYSKAKSPFDAMKLMKEKMPQKFDQALFANLVRIYGGDL